MRTLLARALFVIAWASVPSAKAQYLSEFNLGAACRSASVHAQEQFTRVIEAFQVLGYDGSAIQLCASQEVPNAHAISQPRSSMLASGAATVTYTRFVLYNPTFMTQLEFYSANEFSTLYILAHEVGHHIYGHTDLQNPLRAIRHPWKREIEADYFAGLGLARLGATPADLEAAQRLVFTLWGNVTHRDSVQRISAIAQGWKHGGGAGDVQTELLSIWARVIEELTRWY